jgi:hypothetical protein
MKNLCRAVIGPLLICAVAGGCSSSACPTIACQPTIEMSFRTAIPGNYSLSVTVAGQTFNATCPTQTAQLPGVESCTDTQFVVAGVDLGHAQNDTVDISVTIDGGASMKGTANLAGITNSRSCDLVCFVHAGVLNN